MQGGDEHQVNSTCKGCGKVSVASRSSKYPPAEPGALDCEPLKAAGGVANAAPEIGGTVPVPISAKG